MSDEGRLMPWTLSEYEKSEVERQAAQPPAMRAAGEDWPRHSLALNMLRDRTLRAALTARSHRRMVLRELEAINSRLEEALRRDGETAETEAAVLALQVDADVDALVCRIESEDSPAVAC